MRGFKYQIRDTKDKTNLFWQQAGACRFVWNFFWHRQEYRRKRGHYVESYQTMCLALTQVKKHFTFLKDVDSTILQQTLKDLSKAYKDGFDKTQPNKRLPKKKKKHRCTNSFRYTQRVTVTHGDQVYLPKLGTFRFRKTRNLFGKIKNTTVSFKSGKWYVSFQVEYEIADRTHKSTSIVGVDLGVKKLATLSNGFYVSGIEAFRGHLKKLAKLQKKLAKKRKFSRNWQKIKAQITQLHSTIADVRHDLLHKFSRYLSKNHAIVVFEDLKIKNMTRSAKGTFESPGRNVKQKSGLNKAILDQGWSMLVDWTNYKQKWRGGETLKVAPHGTSQTCAKCGHQHHDNRQTQSVFKCLKCDHTNNADLNASINIEAAGHAVLACSYPSLINKLCKQESQQAVRLESLLIN